MEIVSGPGCAFASWMAARRVHWLPVVPVSTSQIPLPTTASTWSRVSLTVKSDAAANERTSTMIEAVATRVAAGHPDAPWRPAPGVPDRSADDGEGACRARPHASANRWTGLVIGSSR